MARGTVKWFNPVRGFGFIRPDDGSRNVFVHAAALEGSELDELVEGQKVWFDVQRAPNGKPSAANLKAADREVLPDLMARGQAGRGGSGGQR